MGKLLLIPCAEAVLAPDASMLSCANSNGEKYYCNFKTSGSGKGAEKKD